MCQGKHNVPPYHHTKQNDGNTSHRVLTLSKGPISGIGTKSGLGQVPAEHMQQPIKASYMAF